ncbi:MAG: PilN domain-containing protein [Methylococcales bacterium]|nr:PilN domain-containing protein [Methylococcales bacterium]
MVKINLLPWREELHKYKQQEFLVSLGLAILTTCFLFALGYFYLEGRKTYQAQRNAYLEEEIVKLDQKIATIKDINTKKNKLRDKIKIIEDFQANRSEIIHVIDQLRKITPKGISLSSFVQKEDKITLKGFLITNSEVPVTQLMDAIKQSSWLGLDGTGLKTVDGRKREKQKENALEQIEEKKYSQFTILAKQVKQKNKDKDKDKEDESEINAEGSE